MRLPVPDLHVAGQASGQEVDARTDIFSLGMMLSEMISGSAPSAAAHGSKEAQKILDRMLAADRDERYASAESGSRGSKTTARSPWPSSTPSSNRGRARSVRCGDHRHRRDSARARLRHLRKSRSSRRSRQTIGPLRPRISPEGARVAYVTQEVDGAAVRLREVATGRDMVITPPSATEYSGLAFSRDGRLLYYVASDATKSDLRALPDKSPWREPQESHVWIRQRGRLFSRRRAHGIRPCQATR